LTISKFHFDFNSAILDVALIGKLKEMMTFIQLSKERLVTNNSQKVLNLYKNQKAPRIQSYMISLGHHECFITDTFYDTIHERVITDTFYDTIGSLRASNN
jgi:hypothetical protein